MVISKLTDLQTEDKWMERHYKVSGKRDLGKEREALKQVCRTLFLILVGFDEGDV